jgi:hypothetical protein
MQSNEPRQQDPGKGGDPDKAGRGAPAPQGERQPGTQQPGSQTPSQAPSPDSALSPSISPKSSNNNTADSPGDRAAKSGGKGGGEDGHSAGKGNSGSSSPSDEGGKTGTERGPGEIGKRPGDKPVESKDPLGTAAEETGTGERRHERPGTKGPLANSDHPPNESAESGGATNQPSPGGQAGSKQSDQPGSRGSGQPTSGGRPGNSAEVTTPSRAKDRGEDAANREFTRQQVDLALEHLKDQLAKEKPELLKELGWSREEALRFLEAWRKRVAAAQESGAASDAARRSADEALKNLGLRPGGTRLKGGHTAADQIHNLRDAGQFNPPSDWLDAVGAYSRTLAGQRRPEK